MVVCKALESEFEGVKSNFCSGTKMFFLSSNTRDKTNNFHLGSSTELNFTTFLMHFPFIFHSRILTYLRHQRVQARVHYIPKILERNLMHPQVRNFCLRLAIWPYFCLRIFFFFSSFMGASIVLKEKHVRLFLRSCYCKFYFKS